MAIHVHRGHSGKRTKALCALVTAASVLSAGAATASPATSKVVVATNQEKATLKSVFVHYKVATHEMKSTDRVKWSGVLGAKPVGPLMAYDASDHRYWAIANFTLVAPFSYEASVSFQDGGSMGVMYRSASGHWVMKSLGEFPVCPSLVPAVVAHLWKLTDTPACQ
jgi:hypothetical protein